MSPMFETDFIQKLSTHARKSFKEANDIARYAHHDAIGTAHLLLAIFLENGSLGSILLNNMGFSKDTLTKICLKKRVNGKTIASNQSLPLSTSLKDVLRRAYLLASQLHYPYVGTEHLIYALMESDDASIKHIIKSCGIEEGKIHSTIESHLNAGRSTLFNKMIELPEHPFFRGNTAETEVSTIEQFSLDMADDAREHGMPLIGRVQELNRLIQVLTRKHKSNPLLIGEPGVGKTALVEALSKRIERGDVPQSLIGKRILSIDLALVVAGTNFRGEFETRLKEIIREAEENEDVILFIDEIHTIIGTGNTPGGLDAANILKPALARGNIRCIGATTLSEYKRHIEKDPALERRFQSILISEPSVRETRHIITAVRKSYEDFHAVTISQHIADIAVDLSVKYLTDRFLPDKALDIIDEAAALAQADKKQPATVKALARLEEDRLDAIDMKETSIRDERYDEASQWHEQERLIDKKIETLRKRSNTAQQEERLPVTEAHVFRTVSHITGIPLEKLTHEQPSKKLDRLHATLQKRLIGQQEAAGILEETLARSLSGINHPDRPLGSFLFLGPTGVGKTLAGKLLAEEFFGDRSALIRLDMSEFMERHSVAQIIGAPAGYIGYGNGGKLTEKVRRKPYSIVLFDEIEKAHPDVFNILLQILDEGSLTDAEGRSVSFRHTLIILTSNIGTAAFTQNATIGFHGKHPSSAALRDRFETTKTNVLNELKKELRPELLARLDHIIVFNALDEAAIKSITKTEFSALVKRLKQRGISLKIPASVIGFIAEKSFSPEQGGRLIRKNIQDIAERAIARKILASPQAKSLSLSIKNDTVVCS
jgi:ATP-dependent Clp protease ATP-binding subunit ClpC